MPHVSIARSALEEIRDRMARYFAPAEILIVGPFAEDCRAPDGIEEAWSIEKLYGPPRRWVLELVPVGTLAKQFTHPGERLIVDHVDGISVGILTSQAAPRLSVELRGDTIRVHELPDA